MKRWICLMLAVATLFTVTVSASSDVTLRENAYRFGDVNDDNVTNANDALLMLQYTVGKVSFSNLQMTLGDVDVDGGVNASDALCVLKRVVGKLDRFAAGDAHDAGSLSDYQYVDPFATYQAYKESDFEYNTSLSVNGAYATDTTADCSFVMDNTGLQAKTIYRIGNNALVNNDVRRLAYSLQGLVNRDFGRDADHTSIIYMTEADMDVGWLEYMKAEGSVYEGYEEIRIASWDEFYNAFKNQIAYCGVILWDGYVPATANVAGTICGLDGYLPVLAKSPLHQELLDKGIAVKQSLVGLFEDGHKGEKIADTNVISTGSAKNDAYRWALEKYFDRCSANYLAYILDGAPCIKGYEAYPDNPTALLWNSYITCLSNHDYLIARRCFFFDLSPNKEEICDDVAQQTRVHYTCLSCGHARYYYVDELTGYEDPLCDGCGEYVAVDWVYTYENNLIGTLAELGTDQETMLMIYARRYERAKGAMGQLMGFPPWWVKYCIDVEQGTAAATWIEWLYCEYISCYNLAKEADAAQPANMTNGSAYYKYVPLSSTYDNKWEEYDHGLTYDDETTYFTIYLGDYDSSAWLKTFVYNYWVNRGGDKARSRIPLTWCFNPNLSQRVPMVFDYIYANKYDHEFIAAGDSGAGYVIPAGLFGGDNLAYTGKPRPAEYANGDTMWATYCKTFYDRFDIKATGFIINGSNPMTTDVMRTFSTFSTMGSLHNCGAAKMAQYKGIPYVYCNNGIGADTPMSALYEHAFERMNGYNFAAYRTVCISPSQTEQIVKNFTEYGNEKGHKMQYLELYSFLDFAAQSGKGYIIN